MSVARCGTTRRNFTMKTLSSVTACCLLLLSLMACGTRVSQDNYDKVQDDMTTQEVNRILGEPTTLSSFSIGSLSATTAKWVGKSHTITVTFANDKVKVKTYAENVNEAGE